MDLDRPDLKRIFLRYGTDADEQFWGFDQKGRLLPILVQEHGVGRGMPVITQLIALQLGPRSAGNWATTEVSTPPAQPPTGSSRRFPDRSARSRASAR